MYVSTFDGAGQDWDLYTGRLQAQIANNSLQIDVGDIESAPFSVASPSFADFDVRVNAQAIDGPLDNAFGVIFRLNQDTAACDSIFIVLCDLADTIPILRLVVGSSNATETTRFYMFLISSDGYYQVLRGDGSNEDGLQQRVISTWIASDAIEQGLGVQNELRVVGRGDEFQFYINNQLVELCIPNNEDAESTYSAGECVEGSMQSTLIDDTVATGQIGVVARSLRQEGVVVQFDNYVIISPSETDAPRDNQA